MEIDNLEINILYFLCEPKVSSDRRDRRRITEILEEFSDLPIPSLTAVIARMRHQGWVRMDQSGSALMITESGIHRLQTSIACRIYRFDRCRCKPQFPPSSPG